MRTRVALALACALAAGCRDWDALENVAGVDLSQPGDEDLSVTMGDGAMPPPDMASCAPPPFDGGTVPAAQPASINAATDVTGAPVAFSLARGPLAGVDSVVALRASSSAGAQLARVDANAPTTVAQKTLSYAASVVTVGVRGTSGEELIVLGLDSNGPDYIGRLMLGTWDTISTSSLIDVDAYYPASTINRVVGLLTSDLDLDGEPDLVVALNHYDNGSIDFPDGSVLVFRGPLAPGLVGEQPIVIDGLPANPAVVAADLDGDCRPDLVVYIPYAQGHSGPNVQASLSAVRNTSTVSGISFAPRVELSDLVVGSIAPMDVDRDGRLDLVLTGPGGLFVALVQAASGAFGAFAPLMLTGPALLDLRGTTAFDADGDGIVDLVGFDTDGTMGSFRLLHHDGGGQFVAKATGPNDDVALGVVYVPSSNGRTAFHVDGIRSAIRRTLITSP